LILQYAGQREGERPTFIPSSVYIHLAPDLKHTVLRERDANSGADIDSCLILLHVSLDPRDPHHRTGHVNDGLEPFDPIRIDPERDLTSRRGHLSNLDGVLPLVLNTFPRHADAESINVLGPADRGPYFLISRLTSLAVRLTLRVLRFALSWRIDIKRLGIRRLGIGSLGVRRFGVSGFVIWRFYSRLAFRRLLRREPLGIGRGVRPSRQTRSAAHKRCQQKYQYPADRE